MTSSQFTEEPPCHHR